MNTKYKKFLNYFSEYAQKGCSAFLAVVTMLLLPSVVLAQATFTEGETISIVWDENDDPELIAYNVYRRSTLSNEFSLLKSGLTDPSYDLLELDRGTYNIVVTAVSVNGLESSNSNELTFIVQAENSPGNGSGSGNGGAKTPITQPGQTPGFMDFPDENSEYDNNSDLILFPKKKALRKNTSEMSLYILYSGSSELKEIKGFETTPYVAPRVHANNVTDLELLSNERGQYLWSQYSANAELQSQGEFGKRGMSALANCDVTGDGEPDSIVISKRGQVSVLSSEDNTVTSYYNSRLKSRSVIDISCADTDNDGIENIVALRRTRKSNRSSIFIFENGASPQAIERRIPINGMKAKSLNINTSGDEIRLAVLGKRKRSSELWILDSKGNKTSVELPSGTYQVERAFLDGEEIIISRSKEGIFSQSLNSGEEPTMLIEGSEISELSLMEEKPLYKKIK